MVLNPSVTLDQRKKLIYEKFGGDGVVWDMSCGWGGRLLGFLSKNTKHYIGTEPSTKTFDGLKKMQGFPLYKQESRYI